MSESSAPPPPFYVDWKDRVKRTYCIRSRRLANRCVSKQYKDHGEAQKDCAALNQAHG